MTYKIPTKKVKEKNQFDEYERLYELRKIKIEKERKIRVKKNLIYLKKIEGRKRLDSGLIWDRKSAEVEAKKIKSNGWKDIKIINFGKNNYGYNQFRVYGRWREA